MTSGAIRHSGRAARVGRERGRTGETSDITALLWMAIMNEFDRSYANDGIETQ
jgi:hypothetical protein